MKVKQKQEKALLKKRGKKENWKYYRMTKIKAKRVCVSVNNDGQERIGEGETREEWKKQCTESITRLRFI